MNPSTSLGTRSKVGMAKPAPPVRQAGNIGHLLVIRGVYRRSLPSAYAHVKYRCRCRVKTIADFRKENSQALKGVCRAFTVLCKTWDRFGRELIAIDGSKFKAVNSKA